MLAHVPVCVICLTVITGLSPKLKKVCREGRKPDERHQGLPMRRIRYAQTIRYPEYQELDIWNPDVLDDKI